MRLQVANVELGGVEFAISKVDDLISGLGLVGFPLGRELVRADGHLEHDHGQIVLGLRELQNSLSNIREKAFGPDGVASQFQDWENRTRRRLEDAGSAEHLANLRTPAPHGPQPSRIPTENVTVAAVAALGVRISATASSPGFMGKTLFPGGEWCGEFVHMVLGQAAQPPGDLHGLPGDGANAAAWPQAAFADPPTVLTISGNHYRLVPVGPGMMPEPGDVIAYYTGTDPTWSTFSHGGTGVQHVGIVSGNGPNGLIATQGNWDNVVATDKGAGVATGVVSGTVNGRSTQWLGYHQPHENWNAVVLRLEPVN
jgi:cell wall-associated NlpC family hydrolase